jgi:hypothetical protein
LKKQYQIEQQRAVRQFRRIATRRRALGLDRNLATFLKRTATDNVNYRGRPKLLCRQKRR